MKKRRCLAMLLAFVMAFSMSMTSLAAEVPNEVGVPEVTSEPAQTDDWTAADFEYTEMSQKLFGCDYSREFTISGRAISGFSESGESKLETNKHLVIPSTDTDGTRIVGIAEGAFKDKGLESVTFPEGMMVDYDDTVTHVVTRRGNFVIGANAFSKNKLTSVTLPEGVIAVMPSAFRYNELTSVSFSHTIWWIENSSFANNNLTSVGLPATCDFQLNMRNFAFSYNQIQSVRLPNYTEAVSSYVFVNNPGMEPCPAEAPDKEQKLGGVVYMYTDNPDLANKDQIHHLDRTTEEQRSWHQKLIIGDKPSDSEKEWTIDDFTYEGTTITGLSESGIAKRSENKSLVLPDKNTAGEYITALADSTNTYGLFATETEGFTSVSLPVRLEKIGNKAFSWNGLEKVESFPSTLKEIGLAAFQMNHLTSVNLPDSVTKLGGGAFGSNPELSQITLSKGLTEIADGAFGCSTKTEYMTNLRELQIPEGVTKIGNNAFAGNNITNIVIPSTVTEIGNYAFSTKNYLNDACTLTLPEGLTTIGKYAFRNKVIAEVLLPSTVTKLPDTTFLKEYSDGSEAVITKVYVTKEQYQDKTNFPDSKYHEYAIKIDPNDAVWDAFDFTYAEGTEVKLQNIDGKSMMVTPYNVTGLSELGEAKLERNPHMVIPTETPEGVKITGIGKAAFKGNTKIQSVTFPEGAMTSFDGPEGMLAEGLTERGNFIIGYSAFDGCSSLTEVALPEGILSIESYAFRKCAMTEVEIPHTVGWINSGAFTANNTIESVIFASEQDFKLFIGVQAFSQNKIKAVQLPKGVESVGKMTFAFNTGMEPISSNAPSAYKASQGYGVVYMYAEPEAASESQIWHLGNASKLCYAQKLITDEKMPAELAPWNADDFTYQENADGTVTITGLTEDGNTKMEHRPKMVIPEKNGEGKVITAIGASAFADKAITAVELPDTLTSIGQTAFRATKLEKLVLPDSITTLGLGAFTAVPTLTELTLSKNLEEIPQSCFQMAGLTSLVIPSGVKTVGRLAFADVRLTSLSLPATLTSIGRDAFKGHQLTEVTIPDQVTVIDQGAFNQKLTGIASTLVKVTLGTGIESINQYAFRGCALSEITIPSGLKTLHKDACKDGTNGVVKVYTPNMAHVNGEVAGVVVTGTNHKVIYSNLIGKGWTYDDFTFDGATVTGWSAKGQQTRLTNKDLVIPAVNPETGEQITAIGNQAFMIPTEETEMGKDGIISPNGMKSVVIPETVVTIGEHAFQQNSLEEVTFSESVTTIGAQAFHGNQLKKLVLPDNITSLGTGAFATNHIEDLTLSKGLTKIADGAFSMNIRLANVELPEGITEIGQTAFSGARLTSLTLPKTVTKIGRRAFYYHQIVELTIPGNVKEIGESAFEGTPKATTLQKLTLEEGIETIGARAFAMGYLEKVSLPYSLTALESDAFVSNAGTDGDHVVVCYTENKDHLEFVQSDSHRIVYDTKWMAEDFSYTENEDGTVTVTGLSERGEQKLSVNSEMVIPSKNTEGKVVTAIGANAFATKAITSAELPDTLTSIGQTAFRATKLEKLVLPDSVTTLGTGAFTAVPTLAELTLSKGIEDIPQACFQSAGLTSLVVPEGVKTIGRMAFADARLTSLSLPSTLTSIGREAFKGHQLSEVVIPDQVTLIDQGAFGQKLTGIESTLAKVTLGTGLETINQYAFRGCALTEVTIPAGLTTLHKNAFKDGTKGVVVIYTTNYDHFSMLSASDDYEFALIGEWDAECFTYDGETVTGLSEKGQELVKNNKEMVIPDEAPISLFARMRIRAIGTPIRVIGPAAFRNLGLTSVTLPSGLERIEEEAFIGNNLTTVVMPNTIQFIAQNAFSYNNTIVQLIAPDQETYDRLVSMGIAGAQIVYNTTPVQPEQPGTDRNPTENTTDKAVQTGDDAQTLPLFASLVVSLAVMAVTLLVRKKLVRRDF